MKTSADGIKLIQRFEGLRLAPYLCAADRPTIGYGSTYWEDGRAVKLTDSPITKDRAEQLLAHTLKTYESCIIKAVKVPLKQNEFDALVSLVYNIGCGNFLKSTLLRKLNSGAKKETAAQFLRWNKGGGRVLPGLVKRRAAERQMFLTGE